MDNNKVLLTAAAAGIGGVALAYLGHSYLVKSTEKETKMDKAAEKVVDNNGGGFFSWLTSSEKTENKIPVPSVPITELKELKTNVILRQPIQSTPETAESVTENVSNVINRFGGFFRNQKPTAGASASQ